MQRNIPFAFVTGYDREGLPAAFASAAILSKPVKSEELLPFIAGLLANATP